MKAHDNMLEVAKQLQKMSANKKFTAVSQKLLKHISNEMTTDMKALAKSISWKNKMSYYRMKRSNDQSMSGDSEVKKAVDKKKKTATNPPKKKVRLKRKAAPKSFLKEQTENLQSAVWKRKINQLIRNGVHPSSPADCKLPGTPKIIGELLWEGTKINRKTFQYGMNLLQKEDLFPAVTLYKWRKKARVAEELKKNKNLPRRFVPT